MRFCKRTKDIILSSYKSATTDEIISILSENQLRERNKENIEKYIARLIKDDERREEKRKKIEAWAIANPIRYRARTLVNGAKQRAKKKGLPFDLTTDWVENKLIDGRCEITDIKFYIKPYSKREDYVRVHPHSPSLDQILPSEGYTMDNVQIVCDQVNKFKGDRHITSAVFIAKSLIKEHNRKNTPVIVVK